MIQAAKICQGPPYLEEPLWGPVFPLLLAAHGMQALFPGLARHPSCCSPSRPVGMNQCDKTVGPGTRESIVLL